MRLLEIVREENVTVLDLMQIPKQRYELKVQVLTSTVIRQEDLLT